MARFLQTLGALYVRGKAIDWSVIYPNTAKADLPPYAWDLKAFWFEAEAYKVWRLGKASHPLLRSYTPSAQDKDAHEFGLLLDRNVDPYLDDHRVNDVIIFPATGHLETATAAAKQAFGDRFGFLEDITFETPLFLPDEGELLPVKLEVFSNENRYVISSLEGADWVHHSKGKMNTLGDTFASHAPTLSDLQARIVDKTPIQPVYNQLKQSGLFLCPTFKAMSKLWSSQNDSLQDRNP